MSEDIHQQPIGDTSVGRVMWVVAVAEPVTSKDVAKVLDTSPSLAGRQLIRLHRSGLVERRKPEGNSAYHYRVLRPNAE